MKIKVKVIQAIVCGLLAVAVMVLPACQGTPKTVAYKTLKTVSDTVDVAMKAYADAVVAGQVPEGTQVRVRQMHQDYRKAFAQALNAARFDYENAAPAEVSGLAAELAAYIASLISQH